MILKGITP